MLCKIGDRYQAYHVMHKTHTMATYHGGVGCPVDDDINLHIVDTEGIHTEPVNDDDSTTSTGTTIIFGGPEAEFTPSN